MSTTLAEVLNQAGVSDLGVLDSSVDVPVLTGLQAQGDLIIVPTNESPATTPVGPGGVEVVRSEANSNTHSLHSWDGDPVLWDSDRNVLTVPEGSSAYLVHTEEHGANGIGPGTYSIRRQREQADEIRLVAD